VYSKHAYVLQVFEWLPEYYTDFTFLPQEMPEKLKNKINDTLSSSQNLVSVNFSLHKKISLQWGYCTWKCIMTLTYNIHTRQVVYINVTLWHIRTTIVAVETHQSVLCFTTLSHTWHGLEGGGGILNIRSVFWFSLQILSETFLIVRTRWDITIKLHRSSCTVPIILVGF